MLPPAERRLPAGAAGKLKEQVGLAGVVAPPQPDPRADVQCREARDHGEKGDEQGLLEETEVTCRRDRPELCQQSDPA